MKTKAMWLLKCSHPLKLMKIQDKKIVREAKRNIKGAAGLSCSYWLCGIREDNLLHASCQGCGVKWQAGGLPKACVKTVYVLIK